jgi:hypothetical protein
VILRGRKLDKAGKYEEVILSQVIVSAMLKKSSEVSKRVYSRYLSGWPDFVERFILARLPV